MVIEGDLGWSSAIKGDWGWSWVIKGDPGQSKPIRAIKAILTNLNQSKIWKNSKIGSTITLWVSQPFPPNFQNINGIRPEPTNKRFNSAYLEIKYLISRKIHSFTFWLDKTFSCWSQVTMMFKQKDFLKTKKIKVRLFDWGPPCQARQAKKTNSSWKIIEVTHLRRPCRGRGRGVVIILLKLFFFKIPDLVHWRTLAPVAPENRR